MERNKSTKTEKIILIILLFVLVAVIVWAYCVFTDTNLIANIKQKSFEVTNEYEFNKDFNDTEKLNIPYRDKIVSDNSSYAASLLETDNYIISYFEKVIVEYSDLTEEEINDIENYCHTYDTVEYEYNIVCDFKDNKMELKNDYKLEYLNGSTTIKSNKFEFEIDVKYNDKYDKFISDHNYEPKKVENKG